MALFFNNLEEANTVTDRSLSVNWVVIASKLFPCSAEQRERHSVLKNYGLGRIKMIRQSYRVK